MIRHTLKVLGLAVTCAAMCGQAEVRSAASSDSPYYGTYAGLQTQSFATAGRLATVTDSPSGQWVATGTDWAPFISGVPGVEPKAASNFTAIAPTDAGVFVDRNGALHVEKSATADTQTVRSWVETLSSATASVEVAIVYGHAQSLTNAFPAACVVMRESGTGKMHTMSVVYNSSSAAYATTPVTLEIGRWTNHTTRAAVSTASTWFGNGPKFMRLRVSGSNILAEVSTDRQNWSTVLSTALATAFTTAPDQAGVCLINWVANEIIKFDVLHYYSSL